MKKINYLLCMLLVSFSLFNCADDGDPGPVGADGTDGIDGQDGEDGVGFDELTQDGNVVLYFDGTLPNDMAFRDTADYKYTMGIISTASYDEVDEIDRVQFYRYKEPTIPIFEVGSGLSIGFEVDTLINSTGFTLQEIYVANIVKTDDFKAYWVSFDNDPDDSFTVSDYNYDTSTGMFSFNFTLTSSAEDNSTEHELNVSGAVNIRVYRVEGSPS
ncbi:hypothetical protein LVD15_09730 [Fulvivirga maritima]|uniref:hypothetical protein n=1 Tax=Fulvivirga maritima TaxID=2904247 RepID=UPI001F22ED43|nr:hypothetical protein [Fulvivirga maritima]UII28683.1 hypothetical protein LVD15_09730 [Fulvivirga maritima]